MALWKLKQFDDALAAADTAIRLDPADHHGHLARGLVLGESGQYQEQLEALQTAEDLGGGNRLLHEARAFALSQLGEADAALASYERAIAAEPDNASVHTHYSYQLLAAGAFERGWAEYEWRLKLPDYTRSTLRDLAPQWRGEPIAGKKILVIPEQGFGDTLQFLRFLPLVAERGATVTLMVQPPLKEIVRRALPSIDVTDGLGQRTGFDFHVALMSLPHVLKTGGETVADAVPYLFADDTLIATWRDRLGGGGFKVGIAWQGNPSYRGDRWRSVPLTQFRPLTAVGGVRLISAQAVNGLDQLADLPAGMTVETFGAGPGDESGGFDALAALMANLDLVISSDTAVVHLAGALGRPVWVALPQVADWRWQDRRGETRSPWYPTMRLFRQRRRGDWETVFADIAGALADTARQAAAS